ncbi:hypothetical protein FOFC_01759, partial [Fusarium oxysporum]
IFYFSTTSPLSVPICLSKHLYILTLPGSIYCWPILGSHLISIKGHANNEMDLIPVLIRRERIVKIQRKSPWMSMVHWIQFTWNESFDRRMWGGHMRHSRPHTSSCVPISPSKLQSVH